MHKLRLEAALLAVNLVDMVGTGQQRLYARHKSIRVDVTSDIIDKAMPRDSSHCMIADAVRAAVPDAKVVSVDLATIRFTDSTKNERYIFLTPVRAQQALLQFDQGLEVEPFGFHLRGAAQVIVAGRKGARDGNRQQQGLAQASYMTEQGRKSTRRVPTRLGGAPPPNGALSNARGKVRAFGLRQLQP